VAADARNIWTPMKPTYHCRSCPNCGHRVSWKRLWLRVWGWPGWPCPCCGSVLRISTVRHVVGTLIWGAWFYSCAAVLDKHFKAPPWLVLPIFLYGVIPALMITGVRLDERSNAQSKQTSSCARRGEQADTARDDASISVVADGSPSNPSDGSDAGEAGEGR